MEIPNPRRILILSPPSAILTPLLNALTPPSSSSTSTSTSNPSTSAKSPSSATPALAAPAPTEQEQECIHYITTPYYSASIPIWTDTISSPAEWKEEWLSMPGAGDVVSSVGAWVVGFAYPLHREDLDSIKVLLKTVADVLHHYTHNSYDTDAAALFAVALPRGEVSGLAIGEEEWEDLCGESGGWEFIDGSVLGRKEGRNEYGETTGLPRLLEALATNDWESGAADALSPELDLDFDLDLDDESEHEKGTEALLEGLGGIEAMDGAEGRELREPMILRDPEPQNEPLKTEDSGGKREEVQATGGEQADGTEEGNGRDGERRAEGVEAEEGGEENEVEALQALLLKMQAVKDMSADLPVAERRKLARRAVRDVMRGI